MWKTSKEIKKKKKKQRVLSNQIIHYEEKLAKYKVLLGTSLSSSPGPLAKNLQASITPFLLQENTWSPLQDLISTSS